MVEAGGGRRHRMTLESGEHTLTLYAYRTGPLRTVLYYLLTVLTLGIFRLLLHWKQKWDVKFRMVPCYFDTAEFIYIVDNHNVSELQPVQRKRHAPLPTENGEMRIVAELRWFVYRKLEYVWIDEDILTETTDSGIFPPEITEGEWKTSSEIADSIPCRLLLAESEQNHGLDFTEIAKRMEFYGRNEIVVQLRPILYLLCMEVITPFYVFQIFSVTVWYNDEYAYYASLIVALSLGSIIMDVVQIRTQEIRLRGMVHSTEEVEVIRDGKEMTIGSEQLVPGDILLIPPHGCLMQCDSVLMNGTVIVNESVLTGESVPITKVKSFENVATPRVLLLDKFEFFR
uniref:Cation-transporting ATPase n=1 Tax=Caenorhabditis japonica TaxID=281687 RepID=A0A8R1DXG4_CAEJA